MFLFVWNRNLSGWTRIVFLIYFDFFIVSNYRMHFTRTSKTEFNLQSVSNTTIYNDSWNPNVLLPLKSDKYGKTNQDVWVEKQTH